VPAVPCAVLPCAVPAQVLFASQEASWLSATQIHVLRNLSHVGCGSPTGHALVYYQFGAGHGYSSLTCFSSQPKMLDKCRSPSRFSTHSARARDWQMASTGHIERLACSKSDLRVKALLCSFPDEAARLATYSQYFNFT
jgi:hypothetical protein